MEVESAGALKEYESCCTRYQESSLQLHTHSSSNQSGDYGAGLSTLELRGSFPEATLLGVDLSPHFLAVARHLQGQRQQESGGQLEPVRWQPCPIGSKSRHRLLCSTQISLLVRRSFSASFHDEDQNLGPSIALYCCNLGKETGLASGTIGNAALAVSQRELPDQAHPESHGGRLIRFIHAAAEETGLEAESADLVSICLVMHELPLAATRAIIAEAYRLLRPGGTVSVMVGPSRLSATPILLLKVVFVIPPHPDRLRCIENAAATSSHDAGRLCTSCMILPAISRAGLAESAVTFDGAAQLAMQEMNPASAGFQKVFDNPFAYAAFKSTEPWLMEYISLDLPEALKEAGFDNVLRAESTPRHFTMVAVKPDSRCR